MRKPTNFLLEQTMTSYVTSSYQMIIYANSQKDPNAMPYEKHTPIAAVHTTLRHEILVSQERAIFAGRPTRGTQQSRKGW